MSHWDSRLHILDSTGKEQMSTEIRKCAASGSYFTALVPLPDGSGKLPAVGSWNEMVMPSTAAEISDATKWHQAGDHAWPKDSGVRESIDLNGNGTPDVLMHGCTGAIIVSEPSFENNTVSSFNQIGREVFLGGTYYHCNLFQLAAQPNANSILAVGENGLVAFTVTPNDDASVDLNEVYKLEINPITCFDLGDFNDDGANDIVIGKADGYVFCIDNRGHVIAKALAGHQVWAVQHLRLAVDRMVIAVAVDEHLQFYDGQLRPLARTAIGRITAMDRLTGRDADQLILFGSAKWSVVTVNIPEFDG